MQGGLGGGGPNDKNVQILSTRDRLSPSKLRKIHPGFLSGSSVVLHRNSMRVGYATWRSLRSAAAERIPATMQSAAFGGQNKGFGAQDKTFGEENHSVLFPVLGILDGPAEEAQDTKPAFSMANSHLTLAERNSTALFGAGLIDTISSADIRAAAAAEENNRTTAGRVSELSDGSVGRFGWQAIQPTLREFVLNACAVELGLNVPNHTQAADPMRPTLRNKKLDMNIRESEALVAYVASLPRPPEQDSESPEVHAGHTLFGKIGCTDCHQHTLGSVVGIYSDLLLHDMGASLKSGEGAGGGGAEGAGAGYYGSAGAGPIPLAKIDSPPPPTAFHRDTEWRTPPLWGVAESAPYLHDGRAATLAEAIAQHDGQGKPAAAAFDLLKPAEQRRLIAFLNSLAVPGVAHKGLPKKSKIGVRRSREVAVAD